MEQSLSQTLINGSPIDQALHVFELKLLSCLIHDQKSWGEGTKCEPPMSHWSQAVCSNPSGDTTAPSQQLP